MSYDSYKKFKEDIYRDNENAYESYLNETDGLTSYDDIPKKDLFVKLNPSISVQQRQFIANGIRNFFVSQTDYVLVKADVVEGFESIQSIFNIFVAIIAAISLFIAFFLLLVASTQNVNDAIWEYGVLRSMGLTKKEGMRIYIYEAYIVVGSAAILGTIVGFCTATAVAVQFYSFIELPISVAFPWALFVSMIVLSLLTVMVAVCTPVSQVNRRQIAGVLKGQA